MPGSTRWRAGSGPRGPCASGATACSTSSAPRPSPSRSTPRRGRCDRRSSSELVALDHLTGTASRRAFEDALDASARALPPRGSAALGRARRPRSVQALQRHLRPPGRRPVPDHRRPGAPAPGVPSGRAGRALRRRRVPRPVAGHRPRRPRCATPSGSARPSACSTCASREEPVQISVSVGGITVVPTETTTAASLVHAADRAMYVGEGTRWRRHRVGHRTGRAPRRRRDRRREPPGLDRQAARFAIRSSMAVRTCRWWVQLTIQSFLSARPPVDPAHPSTFFRRSLSWAMAPLTLPASKSRSTPSRFDRNEGRCPVLGTTASAARR